MKSCSDNNRKQPNFLSPGECTKELYPWSSPHTARKITAWVQILITVCVISLVFEAKQKKIEILWVSCLSENRNGGMALSVRKDFFFHTRTETLKHEGIPINFCIISVAELFYLLLTFFSQGESLHKIIFISWKQWTLSLSNLFFRHAFLNFFHCS